MSGFLTRMAARATGHSTGATPQVPARFAAAPAVEVVEAPADALATAAAVEPIGPMPKPAHRERSVPTRAEVPTAVARRAESMAPEPVRPQPAILEPLTVELPAAETLQPEPTVVRALSAEVPSRSPATAEPTPAAIAVPVVQLAERRGSASATAAEPSRAPDVVHVSIGRIEVRAPAPPLAPPAPAPSRTRAREPLGLDAYLRGQREVR